MRPTLITFTFFVAATALAQNTSSMFKTETSPPTSCPVGFTAQHQGSPAALWTTSLEDAHKSAAQLKALHSGVHVDLDAHRQIKQAELTVYFVPSGTRWMAVTGGQSAPSLAPAHESSKSFSLVSGKALSSQLDGDLLLGSVASITHVSLMHVTYVDGTEWKAQSSATCSIKPSLYMPVQVK